MGAYIEYIRFPYYKNLRKGTRIDFQFPITALVGPNGTNKSSVLRAVMGCPNLQNLGNFWFATKLDPIANSEGDRPCFIYGYFNTPANQLVEVLKTRIETDNDPNYWEPSRAIQKYGMVRPPKIPAGEPIPEGRSRTRWNAIEKAVVYLDFRATLSAFDKFFYHGDTRKLTKSSDRRDLVINRAPHLQYVVAEDLDTYFFHKVERISENKVLPLEEVTAISKILDKKYASIRLVKHSFFNTLGYSAILETVHARYSEAFAGSGEFSIVMAVHAIMNAPTNSLIIMDEPEVSLHPGAQDRLLDFIYQRVDKEHHQVVISTHSPAIVRKLPPKAIKVFVQDPSGEVSVPVQQATHHEAFFNLGEPIANKIYLIAEDKLAAEILRRALRTGGEAQLKKYEVVSYPGGASSLWMRHAPIYAAANRRDIVVVFDGDMRPADPIPDPATIPPADNNRLGQIIKDFTGCEISFSYDGGSDGGNVEQLYQIQRAFITWARAQVHYLPGAGCPESFVLRNVPDNAFHASSNEQAKDEFEKRAKAAYGLAANENLDGNRIFNFQCMETAKVPLECEELKEVSQMIQNLNADGAI